jgi:dTDP-4-dehydrorhamnose 3,5-epimerase
MRVIQTALPGVLLIEPQTFEDERGFFSETYHRDRYLEHGIQAEFVQDNHARSSRGVLRGLHYQLNHPQSKLVRVVRGEVFDVAVDVRKGSPTFGLWYGTNLSGEKRQQLYIPEGFAHGYCVLSEMVDFEYKVSDFYRPEDQIGIIWNDPDIAISWPIQDPIVSKKDRDLPLLSQAKLPQFIANR